ncbi:MAG: hypothetical protein EP330_10550 [Deltaproteobacteria bacterium]|nr:MAG: hypothetical protein EP330_10550 [Deltaproteobacteria bacterium]
MRWLFTADSDRSERKRREAVEARIATLWAAFADAADHLALVVDGKDAWDPTDWMNQLVWPIEAGIIWEIGRLPSGECELVLTAEATHSLRPLIDFVVARAPAIPGWKIATWREPATAAKANQLFSARAGFSLDELRFEARPGDHRRLDLSFYCDKLTPGDAKHARLAGFATELMLGEREFYRWVGDIRIDESESDEPSFIGRFFTKSSRQGRAMSELGRALAAHRNDQRQRRVELSNLWNQPWAERDYRTQEAEDYSGHADMYAAKTPLPEVWDAAYSPEPFFSECFASAHFCYLKVDNQGDARSQLQSAEAMAGVLQETLAMRGLGGVTGVGEGRRYHYVDLALDDVAKGIDVIRDLLQPANPHLRSWLLFHDAEWADEWIGLFEESPPPPSWAGTVGG